jgi:hypothetical protein
MINTRLQEMLAEARADVRKDEDYWTEEGQGQDTEEAEQSGYLIGYAAGLEAALDLLNAPVAS